MKIKTTTITGLTVSIIIEEVNEKDAGGGLLCYFASVYLLDQRTASRHLVRRSRIPGIAETLHREIQRDGIRAFQRLSVS